jgi:hypothetical protein
MSNIPLVKIPVLFQIPPEIAQGLASGEFIRHGGLVRDSAGQIVAHLKEIGSEFTKSNPDLARAVKSRGGIVVGGMLLIVFVAAGSGTALWRSQKRKAQTSKRVVSCVNSYNEALVGYLAAIQDQTLDGVVVNRLASSLEDLVLIGEELGDRVMVTWAVLPDLLEFVVGFTKTLAEANSVSPPELELMDESEPQAAVVEMRLCLLAQREILDRAA